MNTAPEDVRQRIVPPIVRIVLQESAKGLLAGDITHQLYDHRLRRLQQEELGPRGMRLVECPASRTALQYLIQEMRSGRLVERYDYAADQTDHTMEPDRRCA